MAAPDHLDRPCRDCGQPTTNASATCDTCLRRIVRDELDAQGLAPEMDPAVHARLERIVTAHTRKPRRPSRAA